ncbi:MAG TPA: hypothetical protein VGV35_03710 [Bryobacteraceae bacterium]|nr:hypothetical protein [Bryobacteraceae bacterium]
MKWWLAIFAAILCPAQPAQSPEAVLFGKIQAKVAQNLDRLPDYTCSETIERFRRVKPGGKIERLDTIRLEVAYVGGRELFGWPGSNKIDEPEIKKFVGRGTSGNGDFAILPRNAFLRGGTKIYYAGDTELDGKRAIRFNYRVPETAQSYRLETNMGEAVVGYEGSFWVDPVTLDLMRLTSAAEGIPAKLGLKSTTTMLNYSRVAVGGSTFLLPKNSELHMTDADGAESWNRNNFDGCRQFSGQSVIKFDSPPPEEAAPAAKPQEVNLPEEFVVEIELETPIDSASTAVGDSVRATFRQNVKSNREIAIPKGAALTGNVVRLEKQSNSYLVGLRFTFVDIGGRTIDLSGRENSVGMVRIRNGRVLPMFLGALVFQVDHVKLSLGTVFQFRSRRQQ